MRSMRGDEAGNDAVDVDHDHSDEEDHQGDDTEMHELGIWACTGMQGEDVVQSAWTRYAAVEGLQVATH